MRQSLALWSLAWISLKVVLSLGCQLSYLSESNQFNSNITLHFVPYLTTVVALPGELCGRAKLHGHSVITIVLVLRYINGHSYGSLVLLCL